MIKSESEQLTLPWLGNFPCGRNTEETPKNNKETTANKIKF
jgi:hypothetical protein